MAREQKRRKKAGSYHPLQGHTPGDLKTSQGVQSPTISHQHQAGDQGLNMWAPDTNYGGWVRRKWENTVIEDVEEGGKEKAGVGETASREHFRGQMVQSKLGLLWGVLGHERKAILQAELGNTSFQKRCSVLGKYIPSSVLSSFYWWRSVFCRPQEPIPFCFQRARSPVA